MKDCVADSFRRGALEHIVKSRPKVALYTNLAQYDHTLEKYTSENEVRGDGYQPGGYTLEGGVVIETAGSWVRMQGVFLRTAGGPGQATGIRNLTDMEVLMLYRQMRRARIVAFNKKV